MANSIEEKVMYGYPGTNQYYHSQPTPEDAVYMGRVFAKKGSAIMWKVIDVTKGWKPFLIGQIMDKSQTFKVDLDELSEMDEISF